MIFSLSFFIVVISSSSRLVKWCGVSVLFRKFDLLFFMIPKVKYFVPYNIFMNYVTFFFIVEFQWFFMELSVRPGIIFVISAHFVPCAVWAKNKTHYSWSIQSAFNIAGFKWLCHLSRHCFPSLPATNLAINDHLWGPYFSTNFLTRASSSSVHGFFLSKPERLCY